MSSKEFDMTMDILHALEDFLDAYDNHAEMVVTEAIANAIDVKASNVDICLKDNLDGSKTISFYNDGPPMGKKQFDNYHVLARSSKTKGGGIGFAGIGAKVYLAAWSDTTIQTETGNGRAALASRMYVRKGAPKAAYIKPSLKKPGTLYTVTLKEADFEYLETNLNRIIVDAFNPAIINGLRVSVNGSQIKPWRPEQEFSKSLAVTAKGRKFSVLLKVTKEDIPAEKLHVQYHVSGKIITTKKPEWTYDLRPDCAQRVHAYVDATAMSDQLNLNKTAFKTYSTSAAFKSIHKSIFDVLSKEGYARNNEMRQWERNSLTKFFEKLFKNPEYAFLNPDPEGGGGGRTRKGGGSRGTGKGGSRGGGGTDNSRRRGALLLVFVERTADKPDGWLDPQTSRIVINTDHPLYIKYRKDIPARNQRVATIMTKVLIKNATTKKSLSVAEAFDLQSELLTISRDVVW